MLQIDSADEMREASHAAREKGKRISFIPTMGALHEGHLALFRSARSHGDLRVVSIFVNPTQFNSREDFKKYPRNLEVDLSACEREGIDIVFTPTSEEIYPNGLETNIPVPQVGIPMEGEFRPGHFAGVCAVVDRLFKIVQPHAAIFGEKDYQQFRVIQEMVKEQGIPVEVIPHPTVRDKNCLALSSRNARLAPEGYEKALAVPRAIRAVQEALKIPPVPPLSKGGEGGFFKTAPLLEIGGRELDGLKTDYCTIADAQTLEPVDRITRPSRIFIACWVEGVRLIDNDAL